ncbi:MULTISPECIES: PucR family transcriptional regulator [Paenibacillus]|uniref:PucR family transcriptional regulator n=1 Tax=Paenibacillus lautus TaxID=1401 RepID=A0A1R1ASK1_PAELA|nr:helix-turn-helix domain-containing protein [Paenibacillus lautus]OME88472.1 PucR family transcriptional regulator [Paenibacillus lautus]
MVEMEHIVQKLEQTLGTSLGLKKLNAQEAAWLTKLIATSPPFGDRMGHEDRAQGASSREENRTSHQSRRVHGAYVHKDLGEIWIPVNQQDPSRVIVANQSALTESEIGLITLLLSSLQDTTPGVVSKSAGKVEEERRAQQLGGWLKERLQAGELLAELPEEMWIRTSLTEDMVPFLLIHESEHAPTPSYKALHRLLRSYFGGDIILVPLLDKEWIILANQELLDGITTDDKEDASVEGDQDLLSLFCMGLYELISTEWVGDFHISAIPAVNALHALPQTVSMLRETMTIGRTFQVKEHIHLSTGLHLERLVYSIPEYQRNQFLREYAAGHTDLFEDSETLSTLESFFELDCNVSETAKHLYIHRNTLLYRLDKIKQETGLDVRSFSDAVLVKITLLLYKVTKRK